MPSQIIRAIPPYAILDPERCEEFGRPMFAWHPQVGRAGVNGGGLIGSRGALMGYRAIPVGNFKFQKGGVGSDGTTTSTHAVPFNPGNCGAFQFTTGQPFTAWASALANTIASSQGIIGVVYIATNPVGWYIQFVATNALKFWVENNLTTHGLQAGAPVAGKIITAMMSCQEPNGGTVACYMNGASLGTFTAATPSYTANPNLTLGCRNNTSNANYLNQLNGQLYGALIWRGAKPQRLAEMLDFDSDLMWWWPGKEKGRVWYVPAAPITTSVQDIVYLRHKRRAGVRVYRGIVYN